MKANITRIESIMASNGLTDTDVARRAGLSVRGINYLLNKLRAGDELRPRSIGHLAKGLGVNVNDITEAA